MATSRGDKGCTLLALSLFQYRFSDKIQILRIHSSAGSSNMRGRDTEEVGRTGRYIRWGVLAVVVLLAAGIVASTAVWFLYPPTSGTEPRWYFAPFFFPFGFFFLLFFLFFAFRWIFRPWGWGWGHPYWHRMDAAEVLRLRYARGEISREQFAQMTQDLESRTPP